MQIVGKEHLSGDGTRMFGLDSQDRFPEDVPGVGMIEQESAAKGNHSEQESAARCDCTAVVGHGCWCCGWLCFVMLLVGTKLCPPYGVPQILLRKICETAVFVEFIFSLIIED